MRVKGGYSLSQKRIAPFLSPKRKVFALPAGSSKKCSACRLLLAARGEAAFRTARRFASAPIIRYRSACLVEVRSDFRLPRHSSMRRAKECRHSASSLPPSKRHSHLTTVRRGCCQAATRRDSWRSHVHRTQLRSACSHSSYKLPMPGVEGPSPRLSRGDSMGVFSSEREYPLWCRGAHAALPPALTREKVQPFRAILPSARRAESTCAPAGAKKEHPYGCSFSNR